MAVQVNLLVKFLIATVVALKVKDVDGMPSTRAIVQMMAAVSREEAYPIHRPPHLNGYKLSFEPYHQTFEDFKTRYDRYYDSDAEEAYRFSVFKANVMRMEEHNNKYHHGNHSYFQDVNLFSDKTVEEYRVHNRLGRHSRPGGLQRPVQASVADGTGCEQFVPNKDKPAPAHVDWRKKGAVTHVKNQGDCGSCWTFSSTGAAEGSFAILTGRLLSFSEQQIVDCCRLQACNGCSGGLMDTAFVYLNQTGGLETEKEYKYTAHDDSCQFHKSEVKAKVTGCADVPSTDESALMKAVAQRGPVAVGIDASNQDFMSYGGGVYYNEECSTTQLDHGVLAVGYGTTEGQDYWIVKNSWTTNWGNQGYILMSRNKNNNCGIATSASFPYTAKP